MLSKFCSYSREYGVPDTLERVLCKGASVLLRSGFHKRDIPRLSELAAAADSVYSRADELLSAFLPGCVTNLAGFRSEYESQRTPLLARYKTADLTHDEKWAMEDESSFLLYALVRHLRPSIVLETGVANGHSSAILLSAMDANGHGELHSCDVSESVGRLVSDRRRWQLHTLDLSNLKKSFEAVLDGISPIDLMIHDSDHTYHWMRYEFETVFPRMAPGGVVAGDDADFSYGMIDFCAARKLKPLLLLDKRKVFGVLGRSQTKQERNASSRDDSLMAGAA